MKVRVQFFSQLKELARTDELEMDVKDSAKISDLLGQLYGKFPHLRDWDSSILIGAGLEFVERNYLLRPNEEISIMPPVQGG